MRNHSDSRLPHGAVGSEREPGARVVMKEAEGGVILLHVAARP